MIRRPDCIVVSHFRPDIPNKTPQVFDAGQISRFRPDFPNKTPRLFYSGQINRFTGS